MVYILYLQHYTTLHPLNERLNQLHVKNKMSVYNLLTFIE